MISNFSVALNAVKYKATNHEFRIFFKRETQVRDIEDSTIPFNGFDFVSNSIILSEQKEDSHLVGKYLLKHMASKDFCIISNIFKFIFVLLCIKNAKNT